MKFEVIDNFLDEYTADRIEHNLTRPEFPWYFHDHIAYAAVTPEQQRLVGEYESLDRHQFVHSFKSNVLGTTSTLFDQNALPILDKLKVSWQQVTRAKANLSVYSGNAYESAWHIDYAEPHMVALYYVNTNNGYTEFEDGQKVYCKKNSILIFDGSLKHRGVKQTDTKMRIAININYRDL